MTKRLIDLDDFKIIDIPPDVAKCPYCDAALYIGEIDEWSEDEKGNITPDHIGIECVTEPSLRSKKWEEWFRQHSDMPYVYWMPMEETVLNWLIDNFEFAQLGNEREKLEKWRKSVLGDKA